MQWELATSIAIEAVGLGMQIAFPDVPQWIGIAVMAIGVLPLIWLGVKSRVITVPILSAPDRIPLPVTINADHHPTSVIFTSDVLTEKIRIKFNRICAGKSGATLFMRISNLRDGKFEKSEGMYQLTGSGYPDFDWDEFGIPLIGFVGNEYADEINGWLEIDNPSGRVPRREFRFQLTGIDENGEFLSTDGRGAFVASPDPITAVQFTFLPGEISAGTFDLEQGVPTQVALHPKVTRWKTIAILLGSRLI